MHKCVIFILSSMLLLGTGDVDSVGVGRGRFYTVNVPLRDGMRDEQFEEIFRRSGGIIVEGEGMS